MPSISTAELCYRLYRGTREDVQSVPHWTDLEPWVREAIEFCVATSKAGVSAPQPGQ